MPRCKGCDEEIAFVRLASGKWMPVEGLDAEVYRLHLNDAGDPQLVIVTVDGAVIRGRKGAQHESGVLKVEGYESHFARCPKAGAFRGKGST